MSKSPPNGTTLDTIRVDGQTLAKALGLTTRAIAGLAKDGTAVKTARGSFDLVESTRRYVEKLRKPDGGSKERLTAAQADLAELKLQEARNQLVDASQVETTWAATLSSVRASILGIPPRVQAQLGHLTAHDVEIIDREIRDTLLELGGGNAG